MFYSGEINEQLEDQYFNKTCNIQEYIEDKYDKHKNIYKIILLCFCLLIIIIPFSKNNFIQTPNPLTLPNQNSETEKKREFENNNKQKEISENNKEQKQNSKNNNEQNPERESDQKFIDYSNITNLYIITHKDFKNETIVNPTYKILCDERTQLKNEYKLEIIPTNNTFNILYPKRLGYCEGSKMYPIWKLYKSGNLTTKYVGFFHYRRFFEFTNNIPDLDTIFQKFDIIVAKRKTFLQTNRQHFNRYHIVKFLDETVDIIQEKFPEYYSYAKSFLQKKWGNFCNIFIMKKEDFIKWGEFVYGVILEFDLRHNLTSDIDIRNFMKKEIEISKRKLSLNYQSRIQGFLTERLTNIFYDRFFQKRYEIPIIEI